MKSEELENDPEPGNTLSSGGGYTPVLLIRRISTIGLGHGLYGLFNFLFDYVLYVYVVAEWGMLRGGLCMATLSLLVNLATLYIYQTMKIDWVGSGFLRELRTKEKLVHIERLILWASDRGRFLIFVALNIYRDPFIATAYFKEGDFSGITRRDIAILLASGIVSNLYWIFVAAGISEVLEYLWMQRSR